MKAKFICLILFYPIISNLLMAQNQVYVRDESFSDESFLRFKVQLVQAVLDKDVDLLRPLLADEVRLSNDDGCITTECIIEMFEKSMTRGSDRRWSDLFRALKYGFSINTDPSGKTYFEAPSFKKTMRGLSGPPLLVLGYNVNIRDKPSINSKILRTASYEVFTYHNEIIGTPPTIPTYIDGKLWYEIELKNNQLGYIISDFATNGMERNILVEKIDGEWKITQLYQPPGC